MTVMQNTGLPDGQEPAIGNSAPAAADLPAAASTPPAAPEQDPDALELAAARAAVQADSDPAPQVPAPQDEPASGQPTPPAPAAQPPGPVMIPKQRLDQEAERRRLAEETASYHAAEAEALRARLAAMANPQQPGAPAPGQPAAQQPAPQQPTPSPVELIAAQRQRAREAARQFDQGEITAEQLEDVRAQVDDAVAEIRSRQSQPQTQTVESVADALIMQRQLQGLYAQHPYSSVLSPQQATFLANVARQEAAAAGRPYGTTPADTMALRAHVASLSDQFGPRWGLKPAAQPQQAQQPATQPNTTRPGTQPKPLTQEAQARLSAMDKAAGLPPDTAALGAAAAGDQFSPERIESMSDDEIAALPAAVRNRFLTG